MSTCRFFFLLTVLIVSCVQQAWGTTNRFSAFSGWPAVAERDFFSLSSAHLLEPRELKVGLLNMYSYRGLDRVDQNGNFVSSALPHALGHFFSVGFGVTHFIQVGLAVPVFSWVRFQDPIVTPAPETTTITKVGDVKFSFKERLPFELPAFLDMGFEEFVGIPVGVEDSYLGNKGLVGGLKWLNDFLLGSRFRFSTTLGTELRTERVFFNNIDFQHRFLGGVGVCTKITPHASVTLETQTRTPFDHFFSDKANTQVEFLLGGRWNIPRTSFWIGGGGGTCGTCGVEAARWRGFLTAEYFKNIK